MSDHAARTTDDGITAVLDALQLAVAARLVQHMPIDLRRHVRDRAIREAFQRHYAGQARTVAAKAMANDLATGRADLRGILDLNGGRPLGWRQLAELLDGWSGW